MIKTIKRLLICASGISILMSAMPDPPKRKLPVQAPDHTIWGSSAAPLPGEKIDRNLAWKRLDDKIKSLNGGYGLEGHRTYDRGLPATWAESAMSDDVGLCKVSFGSIKPNWAQTASGANSEAIKKFVQSIPRDRIVYLIFNHEPEDDSDRPGNSPALLQDAFAKFVSIVLASDRPNVHPCFNLTSFLFKPQSPRKAESFNLGLKLTKEQKSQVIASLDGYALVPETSAKELFEANFATMASWGFTRFGVFETGVHPGTTVDARAKWITEMGKWVKSRKDIELISYFHSGVGPRAGAKGWFLGTWEKNGENYTWGDGDGTVAAFAQVIKPGKK